jgi:hypothetical protein
VQPEVVTFSLSVAQSDKIYKAWQEIRKGTEWDALSEAHQMIVKNEMRDAELAGGCLDFLSLLVFVFFSFGFLCGLGDVLDLSDVPQTECMYTFA